jgi:hypothetical protein
MVRGCSVYDTNATESAGEPVNGTEAEDGG